MKYHYILSSQIPSW